MRLHGKMQSREFEFHSRQYMFFEERQSVSRDAYNTNSFVHFGCLFAQGTSKSLINDRFYKGSDTVFCSWWESTFPPRNIKVSQRREGTSRNAYKPSSFQCFWCLFAKGASESSINDMFYRGSETVFCSWWESTFPPGILRFLNVAKVLHGMLINLLVSPDFNVFLRKGLEDHQYTTGFYKGLEAGLWSLWESTFPQGILRLSCLPGQPWWNLENSGSWKPFKSESSWTIWKIFEPLLNGFKDSHLKNL